MIQQHQRFLAFLIGARAGNRSIPSFMFLTLIIVVLPVLAGAQQTCQSDGDINQDGEVTVADALLAFQQTFGLVQLDTCQQTIADISPQPSMPDGDITASDVLCIFQKALSLPSCLDDVPPPNQLPIVDAGTDQKVVAGAIALLSGTAIDPDGTIAAYVWEQMDEQTGGTTVSLSSVASDAMFIAPSVSADETLTFRLTVTDDDGAVASDDVRVMVLKEIDVTKYLTGPVEDGWPPGLLAAVVDEEGVRAIGAAGVRKRGSPEKITVNDLVHIGSNTKAMTSTMLAVLVEDDVFPHDWETTIADVFPELLEEIHSDYHAVDLFQLVRMTGGIPGNAADWSAHQDEPDIIERRYAILRDNLIGPPAGPVGEFLYSNLAYMVAAAMAEQRTEESWELLMEKHLFTPLGITTAGFGPPGTLDAVDQPWGHYWSYWRTLTPVQFDNPEALGPAGRVHISIEDWAKLIALWFTDQTPAILDRDSLDGLLDTDSDDYAAGWFVAEREWADGITLSHNGSNTFWTTTLWIAPDRGIAYLAATNASDLLAHDTIGWVLDFIVGSLIDETPISE